MVMRYLLPPNKIGIKREMQSNYQLKIADFYNIPIDPAKKVDKKVCASL